eukprot:CAMPEP_0117482884 /NCGR_PEP_ID=MMETSP0784-20121206/13649_1 /TAXON_ID=39447 /ORGANISM="" /LENGTH=217 /DNA_ID=CAMNT_0005277393 /DNA_START=128 /DNA_END=781 /DNA_ORIENTATION=-
MSMSSLGGGNIMCNGFEEHRAALARRVPMHAGQTLGVDLDNLKYDLLAAIRESASGAAETSASAEKIDELIGDLAASSEGMQFNDEKVRGEWVLVFTRNADGAPVTQKLTRTKPGNTFANFDQSDKFENVVKFWGGRGRLSATVTYSPDDARPARISCDITDADVRFGWLKIPLPLRAKGGWLDFLYLDDDMRITRGNKGGTFVHIRPAKIQEFVSD